MNKRESKWNKETNKAYSHPDYRKNRPKVLERDCHFCVRCWHLWKIMRFNIQVDHYRNIATVDEADHSLNNLWCLCVTCHNIKSGRESHGFDTFKDPFGHYDVSEDRWVIKVDWYGLIQKRTEGYLKGEIDYGEI